MFKRRFFFLLMSLFSMQFAMAQTALQTSFEAPGYTTGNLNAQNSWTVTSGTVVVSNAKAKTGTQSIQLTAANTALLSNYVAYSGSVPGITGEVYADMWVNPTSFATKNFAINGYDLYGGSSKRVFVIEFTTANQIRAFNGSSSSSTVIGSWTSNQWVRISVKVDFATEKYKVAVNGVVYATELNFREAYTPTASGTRQANIKEIHSLRFNHVTDTDLATTDVAVDDIYIGTTAISDVSFGGSSDARTITVTQPAYGSIALSPSAPYVLNQSVTATLTLPQGYMNNGWTGDLSGTELVKPFTVTGNMTIGANVGIDAINPPPQYTITINQPVNGTIKLSPVSPGNVYYKETVVTATILYEACYNFNGWNGGLSGTQSSKSFTVTGNTTIGADIVLNTTAAVKRNVATVTEFKAALAAMNPGDTVEVADGSYSLSSLTINRSGCELKPIVITARNQGQAILNGNTALVVDGVRNVTIKGFSFQAANIGTGIKILNSKRVRITRNSFKIIENASCNWVYIGDTFGSTDSLKSGDNRVDYNVFDGKTQPGKFIVLDGNIDQQSRHDTIAYNLFKNNGPRVENEKESIRVGVSTLTRSSGYTVIEHNRFEDCDGDPEIVSIKSCDNIVRYNTFVRCLGTLSLRQGFRNTAEGNYFFGEGKTAIYNGGVIGCGGIRVYGKDHKIINNYFHGLTGYKWDAAITITNGNVLNNTTSNSEHNIPENVVIAFNTLNNNFSNIEIGFDNNGNYSRAPVNCIIANNIVIDSTAPIIKSYSGASLAGVSFSNNIMYPSGSSSIGIASTTSQINNINPLLLQHPCVGTDCNLATANRVLRLSTSSPAINTATGDYSFLVSDFEGQARSGAKDIGADEFNSSGITAIGALSEENVGPNAISYSYSYSTGSILPVQLQNFTAAYRNNKVQLLWQVGNETNVLRYEVERSSDARTYNKVTSVLATGMLHYSAEHSVVAAGKNFYRLKIIDRDGKTAYSQVRMINNSNKTEVNLYPNPAHHFFMIDLGRSETATVELRIVNATGIMVRHQKVNVTGIVKMEIKDLPAGNYQLQIVEKNNSFVSRSFSVVK
jgi:poly(beta-D-mannuronate) lyase